MTTELDLLDETVSHFEEGARSVRAYSDETTYIITKAQEGFYVTIEEPGFPKTKVSSLENLFTDVFGIEAVY